MSGHARSTTSTRPMVAWLLVPALVALQFVLPVVFNTLGWAAASTTPTPVPAPVNVSLSLSVHPARDVTSPPADAPVHTSDTVTAYKWLITADDIGDPADATTKCTPTDGNGALVDPTGGANPTYQPGDGTTPSHPVDTCQWPSVRYTPGALAVLAQGDETTAFPTSMPAGKYLVSVSADNFKLGGAHFTVPAGGGSVAVPVRLDPYPLPLGTLRLRVFQDTAPVDGTYEVGVEQGLAGFTVHINDVLGEVTTDFYGNRLCTNYRHFGDGGTPSYAVDANHPLGAMVFDGGAPVIDTANPGGRCLSNADGDVAIPNLGPNRYTATVIAPTGQKWYQTTTLEGNHDWDMWIAEGDTGYDNEQTVGSELVPPVDMGFVPYAPLYRVASVTGSRTAAGGGNPARTTVTLTFAAGGAPATPIPVGTVLDVQRLTGTSGTLLNRLRVAGYGGTRTVTASNATSVTYVITGGFGGAYAAFTITASGFVAAGPDGAPVPFSSTNAGEVKGAVVEINTYVGGVGGVTVPNAGVAGANVRGPVSEPIVTLSDLGNNDQMVYVGRGKTDGTFDITNVPNGDYQLTAWDYPQDLILDSFNVTVSGGAVVDVGQKGLVDWYTDIKGSVYVDTNGNGVRDSGEQGIPGFAVTLKERDNSLLDAGQNVVTTDEHGDYDLREGYPISRWTVLEAFNTRYKTTGVTVQADNEPTPTTYLGAGVDISVLPVIGLAGRVDWGVQPYVGSENGGIVGTVTYDSTRNELDPKYAFTEDYQPGIPGLTLHLFAPVACVDPTQFPGDPLATPPSYAPNATCNADGYWHYADDGATQATRTDTHAPGSIVELSDASGTPIDLYDPYTSETWEQPTGCTPRTYDGKSLDYGYQLALPPAGDSSYQCVEAPMAGWYAKPSDTTPGAFGQTVNGNYGFGTINHDPTDGSAIAEQAIPTGDYIVKVDLPDVNGQQLYQVTKEEDINVFDGDSRYPQEGAADVGAAGGDVTPSPTGNAPISQQAGIWSDCVGADHTVTVTDAGLLGIGGSPFDGKRRPLCDEKLISVRGGQAVAPNFNLFTPVPLPTHFWGLTINDLGLSQDKTQAGYGEAQPLPGVPMGIYDWQGHLLDTVTTDHNGMYEVTEPSTSSYNCPLPAGPCPGMYYFKGNDPGQPGHPNKNYNPRFRTIGTDFQAWPGLFTVTDTAPTQVAQISVAPGTTTINAVDCNVNAGVTAANAAANATPDILNVSTPYMFATTSSSVVHPIQSFTVSNYRIVSTGGTGRSATITVNGPVDASAVGHAVTVTGTSGGTAAQRAAVNGSHTITARTATSITYTITSGTATTVAAGVTSTGTATIPAYTVTTTTPNTTQQVTIKGVGFGATPSVSLTPLGSSTAVAQLTSAPSDTSVTFTVRTSTGGGTPTAGAYQLSVANSNGRSAVNGLSFHVLGTGYNPTLIQVNPPAGNTSSTAANTFTSSPLQVDPNTNPETVLQDALNRARNLGATTALVVVWPNLALVNNPTGDYFENVVLNDNTKIQGVGPGGFQDANTFVPGTRLNGLGFNPDNVQGANWINTVTSYNADVTTVPDSADVTVLGSSSFGTGYPATLDGFTITGGSVADFPTNLDTAYGGTQTPIGGPGALVSQGGGVYLHDQANNMQITNNVIVGNSGAYGGAIRVGTPYSTLSNSNVNISRNRITDNGGTNLAGGVALFDGSNSYKVDHNDICGNFSAEYGGGISHYGLSSTGSGQAAASITFNRVYLNGSYDEGGGVMIAGELNSNLSQPSAGSGPVTVDGNLIQDNLANDDGGGIRLLQAGNHAVNITNNLVVDNISAHEGGGLALDDSTNVRIVGNTVMKNITTATAVTSNGQPAPAGLSTASNSVQLQNTLPTGSALYSKPTALLDNIFWDNRAGTWNPATGQVDGIGTGGNVWDLGSVDSLGSNLLNPTNSLLSASHPQVAASPTNKVGLDPLVVSPYDQVVQILTSRIFPSFREAVIVANPASPQLRGNYHLSGTGSPANNSGVAPPAATGVTALLTHDYDNRARAAGAIEIGADEIN